MKYIHMLALLALAINSFAQLPAPASGPTEISPLLVGERIPPISLEDAAGNTVPLQDVVRQKPTVLIFYRGGWCPYCNVHLAELQSIESKIIEAGYQIIAISPDSPENLRSSITKNKLNYVLLSDASTLGARHFGLAFTGPDRYADMLNKASGGQNKNVLPVPAVFVLNIEGEILFEHINPDYKKRIKASMLMAVLSALD